MRTRKFWQPWEDDYMREHYPYQLTRKIAQHLNRTTESVYGRSRILDIHKSQAFRDSKISCKLDGKIGKATRFKKGHKPWNTGKKGLQIGGKATQFKKGIVPHNTKYDGHTRIDKDGYVLIRVKKGVYKHLHRLNYEKKYGKIPAGMIVTFKDGNKRNCEPGNLEMISLSEKQTIRTLSKLNKTIRKNEKQN